jgi:hypothetical protein
MRLTICLPFIKRLDDHFNQLRYHIKQIVKRRIFPITPIYRCENVSYIISFESSNARSYASDKKCCKSIDCQNKNESALFQ